MVYFAMKHEDTDYCYYHTSANRLPNMYRDWAHFSGQLPTGTRSTVWGLIYSSSTLFK